MNWPTFLGMTCLSLLAVIALPAHATSYSECDQTLGNLTCIQTCNGSTTCNSSCPSRQGYSECFQQCSNSAGCPGTYNCVVPNLCKQECYDGKCYCSAKNCTQVCSSSYCKNTAMTCHSGDCGQTCSGDCNLDCTKNALGVCQQDCTGVCRNLRCNQKSCIQKTYCRNPPCTLECSSNVEDCRQTCSYGKCSFKCNARRCTAKCNSGICSYEGNPLENMNNKCDKIDLLSKQCFQEGCGWPNCSFTCANGLPGLATGCSQSCMEPKSPCPNSMTCSYADCMQNCFGSCQKITCDRNSKRCGQLCEGRCDILHCNATTHCLQHCGGDCNTMECTSAACLQSCKSKNCVMKCNDHVSNCSQTCTTEGTKDSCAMESKALTVEHQSCNKNCTSMTCGENSVNCTQTCGEGCARMVCSSSICDQECANGGCILECTSSVKYCKQTCRTGNCTVKCLAQDCVQDCGVTGCLPRQTTTSSPPASTSGPTSTKEPNTTEEFMTTRSTEPTATSSSCEGETSAQRKIESLIQNRNKDLVVLLFIVIGLLVFLVLVILAGFICILRRLKELSKTGEPQLYNIEGKKNRGYDNTAF